MRNSSSLAAISAISISRLSAVVTFVPAGHVSVLPSRETFVSSTSDLRLYIGKSGLALGKRILSGGERLGEKPSLLVEGIDLHGDFLELGFRVGNLAFVALRELAVLLDTLRVYADDFVGAAIGIVSRRLARRKRLETLFELVHLGMEFLLSALRLCDGARGLFDRLVYVAPVRRVLHKFLVEGMYLLL